MSFLAVPLLYQRSFDFRSNFTDNWTDDGFGEQKWNESSPPDTVRATCVTVDGKECVRLHTESGDDNVAGSGLSERNDLTTSQAWTNGYSGEEQWWEFSMRFPDDYVQPPESVPAGQWHFCAVGAVFHHATGPGYGNFQIIVYPETPGDTGWPTGMHLELHYGADPENPTQVVGIVQEGAITKNVWYRFVYHVKWASDGTGFFKCWVNGTLYMDHSGPTIYAGNGVYMKVANYHSPMGSASSIVYTKIIRDAQALTP